MKNKHWPLGALSLFFMAFLIAVGVLLGPARLQDRPNAGAARADQTPAPDPATSPEPASGAADSGVSAPGASATAGSAAPGARAGVARSAASKAKASRGPARSGAPGFTVQDAGMPRNFVLALDEIWVTDREGKGRVVAVEAASAEELEQLVLASSASGEPAQAILYEAGVARNEFTRRVVSSLVTVRFDEDADPAEVARRGGASSFELPDYAPGFAVLRTGAGLASLRAADLLAGQPGVLLAEAQLGRQHAKRAMPNDALINQQWHLKFNNQSGALSGTDLNIEPVWAYPTNGAGYRGRGILIGIVDDGVQTSHPDFVGNIDTVNDYDWNDSSPNDPSPGAGDDHGTACAGDAAARGNNGIGVSGSAPEATIVGLRLIAGFVEDDDEAAAMNYLPQLIQIKSNSWGPSDTGTILEAPGPLTKAALKNSAETGRGGKGTIFMWAGGNGLTANDNSNYDGYANSIYTIAVGAFDSRARQAYYSEPGANLVITSPSDGASPALGKTTTDRTGSAGYASGDYTDDFGGTSSATPTAAGVVALMLEANPNLGWRDVQEILMRSARKVNPSDADWKTPVGPDNINHNHKFGGGLVDAAAAVNLAVGWTNLGEQLKRTVAQTGLSVAIPNQNTTGITREFTVAAQDNIRVEQVTVTVNINHTSRGNLKITLTSPSGTVSRLAEVHSDSGDNFSNWTFMTVRNWGENAAGTWRLKITDESGSSNTNGGTLTAATLEIFGASTEPVNPPPSVALTSPSDGTIITPGSTVTLSATATDLDADGNAGAVANVEFLANGNVVGADNAPPYAFTWQPPAGNYAITARVTDNEGATATTAAVNIQVRNQRPVVTAASITPTGEVFTDQVVAVSSVVAGDADGDAITYAYHWQSSVNGAVYNDAAGLTADTLPPAPERSGFLWRCRIIPSDAGGEGEAFFTAAVALNRRPPSNATVGQAFAYDSDLFLRGSETSFTRKAILSEFSQGPSGGSAEWVEFLVLKAGSLRGWKLQDAAGGTVTLADVAAWDNIPAGTLVLIYNGASKDPLLPADDVAPGVDARMIVSSTDATMCTGAWPSLSNNGDGIILRDAGDNILSQVGYGSGTTTPNIGAAGSGKSANYRGGTEDGGLVAANWSIETSAAARGPRIVRAAGDLFISEYVEGSSNNKAIEVYNPSGAPVNLGTAGYVVQNYANGTNAPTASIPLTGTIQPGSVHVLVHASAGAGLLALGNQSTNNLTFNGDDTVVLRKDGTNGAIVDVFGQIGFRPATAWTNGGVTTVDRTLRRKSSIVQGDTNGSDAFNPSVEWDAFPVDTFGGLGSHTVDGGGGGGGSLTVAVAPSTFAENAGPDAATGTLTLGQSQAEDLTVSLASSDATEATVPASVTIPAGQTTATFAVAAVDDEIADGAVSVTITATAGALSATAAVTVTDNEISLDGVTPGEPNGGDNSVWVQQLRSGALNQPALFRLGAGNPSWLTIEANSGLLGGTPDAEGVFTIALERYNSLGETAVQTFQITVGGIVSEGFTEWIAEFPGLSDPAPVADPDGDGLPNLVEYFMALSPADGAVSGEAMVLDTAAEGAVRMDYRRSKSLNGVSGGVAWRNDLSAGAWSTEGVVETVVSDHGTYEIRRATVPVVPGEDRKFLRLEVEQQ